jgi:FkbM family methyltransferase
MNVDFLKKYFIPSSILDIGAHSGEFYKECVKIFPHAYYLLVEGNADCLPVLKELNVPYFIGLLGNSAGYSNFYRTKLSTGCIPTNTGLSMYREKTSYYNEENVIVTQEPVFLLDSIVNRTFDLIKLDVQGAELDILRGGKNIVQHAKGIMMEVSVVEYNENAPLEEEVLKFMDTIGFTPVETVDVHMHPETHEYIQKDVFFLRKDFEIMGSIK